MVKHILILSAFLAISFWGRADGINKKGFHDDIAGSAIRNSIKFNYDLINETGIDESSSLSDDFNMPVLRPHWNVASIENDWTLRERPGYLRIRAQQKTSVQEIHPGSTFSQNVKLNSTGEAVSFIDISSMSEGTHAGLYLSSSKINYIGVQSQGGKNNLVVCVANKIQEGPKLNAKSVLLRVTISVSKAWFEYSIDGVTYTRLGSEFNLNALSGKNGSVGIYCLNNANKSSAVDVDWFYYNPKVDDAIRFAENEKRAPIPEIVIKRFFRNQYCSFSLGKSIDLTSLI
jgi:beta-xylosidase